MSNDAEALYSAYAARDARFDGVFYVGVTSTGIYCRPVCTARTPRAANCRFFDTAAAAEQARFRPCLRCRPELAPGNAPVDDAQRLAALVVHRMNEGMLREEAGLERMAGRLGWSARQVRRIVKRELGVSPIELVLTRRLLLAKQLLTETTLPVSAIAFASGFASLRRFNDAFLRRYGMPPTRLRKGSGAGSPAPARDTSTLQLAYRAPFAWEELLAFLRARAMAGVEHVDGDAYARTVCVGPHAGWIRVRNVPGSRVLQLELPNSLMPALPAVLGRVRHLFDLDARPDVVDAHLARDPLLASSVARVPGLRVPGAFDGFELAVRTVLGQQVSVKAATTFGARYVAAFGEPADAPLAGLTHATPTAARVAGCTVAELQAIGITEARAATIAGLAQEVAAGRLVLEPGADVPATVALLVALPGIGPWTAGYIAMRALRWPDAFLKDDLIVRRRLGDATASRAEAASGAWQPWRSYAVMHLWAGHAAGD